MVFAREIGKYAAPVVSVDQEQAAQFGQVLDQNISELQRVTIDFLDASRVAREEDEKALQVRLQELESSYIARSTELEEQKRALELRRKELNDREPQHERRRLREHLTAKLQEVLAQPKKTANDREWLSGIFYLGIAAVFISISAALSFGLGSSQGPTGGELTAFWVRSVKSLVSGVAGAAFAWAGLANLKSSARAFREYEQQIQRYSFDMDRASWVVETLLQMSSMEKGEIPDQWLEAACRDLFHDSSIRPEEPRSLDALAALLDTTARAKIGSGGFEFELDRKQARELAQQAR